jgi:phosphoserine aminotransferase
MLCVEDWISGLEWAAAIGGLEALVARADANAAALDCWVRATGWIEHLAVDPATRSNTSVCLKLADAVTAGLGEADRIGLPKRMAKLLEAEQVAYDIASHRDAPPGLRIWCGATVDTVDIDALEPWLDYAWKELHG